MLSSLFKKNNYLFLILTLVTISVTNAQEVRVIDNKGTLQNIRNNQVTVADTAPTNPLEGDVWYDTTTTPITVNIWDEPSGSWEPITNTFWGLSGNSGTNNTNFLGTVDDVRMQIRSNNLSLLEFGRRQTLGLTQSFPDYTDNDQPLIHLRGNDIVSALQFTASGADFYKPMFFTTPNGSFRLKGSSGRTDLFEIGSAGPNNDGRLEFIIGDDGQEPMVFKRYDFRNGQFFREFFRVQGSNNTANAKTRFGININTTPAPIDLNYDDPNSGFNIANSTLQVDGSISTAIFTTTANLTLDEDYHTIILGGNHNITLPAANICSGRIYVIKNPNAFTPTISAFLNLSGTITTSLISESVLWIQSDGTNWQQINSNSNGGNNTATIVSTDTNNQIATGTDGGAYLGPLTIDRQTIGYTFAAGLTQGNNGNNLYNINSSVINNANGRYTITFGTPHPNGANYSVVLGVEEDTGNRDGRIIQVIDNTLTANGFQVMIVTSNNNNGSDNYVEENWSFEVAATISIVTNVTQGATPPTGGATPVGRDAIGFRLNNFGDRNNFNLNFNTGNNQGATWEVLITNRPYSSLSNLTTTVNGTPVPITVTRQDNGNATFNYLITGTTPLPTNQNNPNISIMSATGTGGGPGTQDSGGCTCIEFFTS